MDLEDLTGGSGNARTTTFGENVSYIQRLYYGSIKPGLSFPTGKALVIYDWRLGLLYRVGQLLVVIYIFYNVYYKQLHLAPSNPSGTYTMGVLDYDLISEQKRIHQTLIEGGESFCNDITDYHYSYDSENDQFFEPQFCSGSLSSSLYSISPQADSIFFETYGESNVIFSAEAINGEDCSFITSQRSCTHVEYAPSDLQNRLLAESVGKCRCFERTSFLQAGVDSLILELDHHVSALHGNGYNVRTYVKKLGDLENKHIFEKGGPISASLGDLLRWAEVDLDVYPNVEPNLQWLEDKDDVFLATLQGADGQRTNHYPYPRLTGLVIDIELSYSNFRMAEEQADDRDDKNDRADIICIMTMTPTLMWTTKVDARLEVGAETISARNGVRITFHTTGLLYAFDFFLLLDCIVQGLVLISTANMAVAFTARFLLGTKSVLYNNVMVDKLDALTQYSQFTSQAVVASVVFDILDDNGQGELEKVELFRRMTELFYDNKETFSWEMVATLVELVFDCASTDNNDHWELIQEEGKAKRHLSRTSTNDVLTRKEWINMFAGAPITLETTMATLGRKREQGQYTNNVAGSAEQYRLMYEKVVSKVECERNRQIRREKLRENASNGDVAPMHDWDSDSGLDGDMGSDSPRVLRRDLASLRNEAKSGFRSQQEHLRQQSIDVQSVFDKLEEMEGNIKTKMGHDKSEVQSLRNQVQQLSNSLGMLMGQVSTLQVTSETALATNYRMGNPLAEMVDNDSPISNSADASVRGPLKMKSISSALRASSALEFSNLAEKRRHMQHADTPKQMRKGHSARKSRDDSDSGSETDGDNVSVVPRPAGNRFTNPPKSKPWYQIEFQGCSSYQL